MLTQKQQAEIVSVVNHFPVGVWKPLPGFGMKVMLYRSGNWVIPVNGHNVSGKSLDEAIYNALTVREETICSATGFWYDTSFDVPFDYDTSYDVKAA